MIEKDDFKDRIIDEYYGENPETQIQMDYAFKEKMEKTMSKMDGLEALDFDLDINILEIIAKGEKVKDSKKVKFELAGFIAACFIILVSSLLLVINTKPEIYLYIYAAVSLLLPLIVIPIAKSAKGDAL